MQARWIDRKTVFIPAANSQNYQLFYSAEVPAIALQASANPGEFHLPDSLHPEIIKSALKGQLEVRSDDFSMGVQIGGVLDDLFYFDGKLGPQFPADPHENISIAVWAPTAQSVKLLLFSGADFSVPADVIPMVEANGVWSVEIENSWRDQYYLFNVKVWVPKLQQFVENIVTDPYSVDLALNGRKSRLTDLNDPATKPAGWDEHALPEIAAQTDLTIWELHVRDFSASDLTVPVELRGSYLAFTQLETDGMRHLRRLAEAGLKAVHLLPTFHIASVNEDKTTWKSTGDLSGYAPDGTEQQAAVEAIKDQDAFNWGYDPVHYMAPEGSYAVNPAERVKEYRAMVQALHKTGLRVIQDQVFNHTSASGQSVNSVLDKIVPGYYYRLDADGNVMNATCCSDTASERRMMEKLMVDALVQNARQYKIDGFRFDLMGYHFVSNMLKIQAALGEGIYLYGEGWAAQETENIPGMPNATQANLRGSGIGTFNDRMRDAIRGGDPFADMRLQGFATGSPYDERRIADIRASLAASGVECVNYCSVHDNQTLFDAIQLKAPDDETAPTRARRQVLALSLIALAQGVPFFHAGDELLRSKNMDNNSYNSGDWFNKLDFTYQSNNWGTGLPLASENKHNWDIMQPLLANAALKPSPADIVYTRNAFENLLRVRYSSGLFRMRTAEEAQSNLSFLDSEAGVIAMALEANSGTYDGYQQILVVFNGNRDATAVKSPPLEPHPAMPECGTFDADSRTVTVAGLTAAVFVGHFLARS